jgi:hypothetical protein
MSTDLKSRISSANSILKTFLKTEDPDTFLTDVLMAMGIDDSEIGIQTLEAETTTYNDFRASLEKTSNIEKYKEINFLSVPEPRIKLAWSALTLENERKSSEPESGTGCFQDIVKTLKPVGQWSDLELLQVYGRDCATEVEDELRKKSKGRFCIVFQKDGTVDVENSLYMLRKARHQETTSTFMIQNETRQIYKVGEFPLDVLYQCPVHKNVLLVDGYCEECGIVYDTKEMTRLVFLRLIREQSPQTEPRLYRNMTFNELTNEFPKVYITYKQLDEEDRLPSLKQRVSRANDSDPFRVSTHKVY